MKWQKKTWHKCEWWDELFITSWWCWDGVVNHDDNDNDDYNGSDAHDPFSYFASSDESPSSYQSSTCDGTHSEEDYNNDEDINYLFAYASSSPCATRSNNHNAVVGISNAINVSNNWNAVGGSDDDIMTLSFTNKSLQPNVSASDSSSFIGLHHNLEHNAHLKVKRYNVGEDSSHGETARVVQYSPEAPLI